MKAFNPALKFAAHCAPAAGKSSQRPWLECVCFDVAGNTLTLIGLDGNRMAAVELRCEGLQPGQFMLPIKDVKTVLNWAAKRVAIAAMTTEKLVLQFDGQHEITFDAAAGKYPDWRRVDPTAAANDSREAVAAIGVQPDFLAAALTALNKLSGAKQPVVRIEFRGPNSGILATVNLLDGQRADGMDGPRVVVMPCRL